MTVIELDLYAPPGPEPVRRRRPLTHYRRIALVVVLLLTLALGGAARPTSVLWVPAGALPITPQGTYQLVDGRIFTFDDNGATVTLTAWSSAPVRRLWSRDDPVATEVDGSVSQDYLRFVRPAGGGNIALQMDQDTTVLDAATGTVRWHRAAAVEPVTGPYGVVYAQRFDGTGSASDDGQNAYLGTDGQIHLQPPVHTDVQVVDMATGAVRWTAGFTGGATATSVPGRPGVLLFYAGDGVTLRDAATGTVLATRALPAGTGPDPVFGLPTTGDLAVVTAGRTVIAYSLTTLAELWRRPAPEQPGTVVTVCGDVPCISGGERLTALDPATGRDRWDADIDASLRRQGPDVYVVENTQSRVLEVRDPVTGALRADLRRWNNTSIPDASAPVVLSRADPGGVAFGLLRSYGRIQLLGRSGTPVTECQNDTHVIVCRTPTGAAAWTYLS